MRIFYGIEKINGKNQSVFKEAKLVKRRKESEKYDEKWGDIESLWSVGDEEGKDYFAIYPSGLRAITNNLFHRMMKRLEE